MSQWGSRKARRVLAALLRIGWTIKRQRGTSHRIHARDGWPDVVFAFHDGEEIGPKMLARIAKHTGLEPDDLKRRWNSGVNPPSEFWLCAFCVFLWPS